MANIKNIKYALLSGWLPQGASSLKTLLTAGHRVFDTVFPDPDFIEGDPKQRSQNTCPKVPLCRQTDNGRLADVTNHRADAKIRNIIIANRNSAR